MVCKSSKLVLGPTWIDAQRRGDCRARTACGDGADERGHLVWRVVASGGVGHVGCAAFLRHRVPVSAVARPLLGDGGSAKRAEGMAGQVR